MGVQQCLQLANSALPVTQMPPLALPVAAGHTRQDMALALGPGHLPQGCCDIHAVATKFPQNVPMESKWPLK